MINVLNNNQNLIYRFKNCKKLNLFNADILKQMIIDDCRSSVKRVMLDLQGIGFIDSTGFNTLLQLKRYLHIKGKKFFIINVNDNIKELLHLMKLENVLHIYNEEDNIAPKLVA